MINVKKESKTIVINYHSIIIIIIITDKNKRKGILELLTENVFFCCANPNFLFSGKKVEFHFNLHPKSWC